MRAHRILPLVGILTATGPEALFAAGGSGGVFDVNPGLSLWATVVFLILLWILGRFAWGPILQQVEKREDHIQSSLDEAREHNAEAERLLKEHKAQLADARRQANDLIAEAKVAAQELRTELQEEARADAERIRERTQAEIRREWEQARDTIRREAVELALSAASQLLHERLDGARDRELVERFLDEVADEAEETPA